MHCWHIWKADQPSRRRSDCCAWLPMESACTANCWGSEVPRGSRFPRRFRCDDFVALGLRFARIGAVQVVARADVIVEGRELRLQFEDDLLRLARLRAEVCRKESLAQVAPDCAMVRKPVAFSITPVRRMGLLENSSSITEMFSPCSRFRRWPPGCSGPMRRCSRGWHRIAGHRRGAWRSSGQGSRQSLSSRPQAEATAIGEGARDGGNIHVAAIDVAHAATAAVRPRCRPGSRAPPGGPLPRR